MPKFDPHVEEKQAAMAMAKLSYSVPEAVKATGLGRTFLYDKIRTGELLSKKIGGRRVILRADLVTFLDNA